MVYVGRFAPSPTGPLHLGTLAAAVASYLHARQSGGQWLVRIEDIDPPREFPGAADDILRTLELLELEWDGPVRYQRTRNERFLAAADDLRSAGLAYYCNCSRRLITKRTGSSRYPGTCRNQQISPTDAAIRVRAPSEAISFRDEIQGAVQYDIDATDGDFVIVRRDGLPAYHLAVVIDDADEQVTDIVRGGDLLHSTPLHIHLQHLLKVRTPRYWHIPVMTNSQGEKLSKSAGAPRIDTDQPGRAAAQVLALLGQTLPSALVGAPPAELWAWATGHVRLETLRARSIVVPTID